jgi:multicomponent Na+:H+ antiporter subunit E
MWNYVKLRYKLFLVLLVFWFLLQLNLRIETVVMGILICGIITELSHNVLYDDNGYLYHAIRLRTVLVYVVFLFREIYKAGFHYVGILLFRHYEPVVFTIRLDVDDPVLVGIIANSITLTPGTISIEVDSEHFMITVLTMAKPGTTIAELERPIHDTFERLLKQKGDL